MRITRSDAVKMIGQTSRIFCAEFIKRSNNARRKMVCRRGVVKHLKGGVPAYDFREKGLIPVFDMRVKEYRSIPIEGLRRLRIDGRTYRVVDEHGGFK